MFRGPRGAAAAADRRHRGVLVAGREGTRVAHAEPLVRRLGRHGARRASKRFVAETGADELIVAAAIHDHAARVTSYEILAGVRQALSSRLPA